MQSAQMHPTLLFHAVYKGCVWDDLAEDAYCPLVVRV